MGRLQSHAKETGPTRPRQDHPWLVVCAGLSFLSFPVMLVLCFVGDKDKPEARGQEKARGDAS